MAGSVFRRCVRAAAWPMRRSSSDSDVARVTVRPAGVEFDVLDGESLFDAAAREGYRWPTVCGGIGSCTTCYAVVVEGQAHLAAPTRFELEGLSRLDVPPGTPEGEVRLACQVTVDGDVTVVRSGVRARKSPAVPS